MLFDAIRFEKLNSNQEIVLLRDHAIDELRIKLSQKPYYLKEWLNLIELSQKLNVSFLSFEKASKIYQEKEKNLADISVNQKK